MAGDTCGSCSRNETRRSAKRSSASGTCGTCAEMPGDADIVLVDGKVFTAARDRPWAKALAVRGDRLLAVGTSAQGERWRSEEHTSELQSQSNLVCRLLLGKKT